MARLNIFENAPFVELGVQGQLGAARNLQFLYVYLPGSLSFNKVAMFIDRATTLITSQSLSIDIGVYTYNAGTLSLMNSAGFSTSNSAAEATSRGWVTFATSAAQDLPPGEYWLGVRHTVNGTEVGVDHNYRVFLNASTPGNGAAPLGPLYHGFSSTTASALPASVATSDLSRMGAGSNSTGQIEQWYVLIAA